MIISRAIKSDFITQLFGENKNDFYKKCKMTGHDGLYDIACINGSPIFWDCDLDGEVVSMETRIERGYGVYVKTEENGVINLHQFWHLQKFGCKVGEILKTGDLIGWSNNTGNSTGPHLHRGLYEAFKNEGFYTIKNQNNGYYGAIPFEWKNKFVLENLSRSQLIRNLLVSIIKNIIYK
jgi:murein DD-endopeptidase MepM/ murein hydrolase activator NlpD